VNNHDLFPEFVLESNQGGQDNSRTVGVTTFGKKVGILEEFEGDAVIHTPSVTSSNRERFHSPGDDIHGQTNKRAPAGPEKTFVLAEEYTSPQPSINVDNRGFHVSVNQKKVRVPPNHSDSIALEPKSISAFQHGGGVVDTELTPVIEVHNVGPVTAVMNSNGGNQ
jgi:hypothetical protein